MRNLSVFTAAQEVAQCRCIFDRMALDFFIGEPQPAAKRAVCEMRNQSTVAQVRRYVVGKLALNAQKVFSNGLR